MAFRDGEAISIRTKIADRKKNITQRVLVAVWVNLVGCLDLFILFFRWLPLQRKILFIICVLIMWTISAFEIYEIKKLVKEIKVLKENLNNTAVARIVRGEWDLEEELEKHGLDKDFTLKDTKDEGEE
jgi:hypothetical protein